MPTERVTVTLPAEMVRQIGRLERNRSRFVLEAVAREIARRQAGGSGRAERLEEGRIPDRKEAVMAFVGIASSGRPDGAERHDEALDESARG